jgi:hypothetical protein
VLPMVWKRLMWWGDFRLFVVECRYRIAKDVSKMYRYLPSLTSLFLGLTLAEQCLES